MKHPERHQAKRVDVPYRCAALSDIVYHGRAEDTKTLRRGMREAQEAFYPPAPTLCPFVGEMHGHTNLSDGTPDIDTYFTRLRDVAGLDFAVVSDHDHGGVGKPTLWEGSPSKWDIIRDAVKRYREEGKFTTILAYERDSYPFYDNLVFYFRDDDAALVRDVRDGELTAQRLREVLADENIITAPHDTYLIGSSTDFAALDVELITPLMEVISRGDAAEYMGNPAFVSKSCFEGGFLQDALKKGAKIGVLGASDDHKGMGGLLVEERGYPGMYPGVTGVWAEENTHDAIFDAIRAKRTYAFMLGRPEGDMRGRMEIDFRINGHWMGETIRRAPGEDLSIYLSVKADVPVKQVTLVKNCRNYVMLSEKNDTTALTRLLFDYKQENDTDYFYLRVELADGRFGWCSPVWVEKI